MTPTLGNQRRIDNDDKPFLIYQAEQQKDFSFIDPDCYKKAEKQAVWYLNKIFKQSESEEYLQLLELSYQKWAQQESKTITKFNLSELERKESQNGDIDSFSFLEKLEANNQLKAYLEKSLTYIFMRDLGKSLDDKKSTQKINAISRRIQQWIKKQSSSKKASSLDNRFLFQKAKEFGVEKTFIWLTSKLAQVQRNMPEELDKTNGLRKLVKIIAGVVLHQFIDLPTDMPKEVRASKLDTAIRLGYCYGLTYPFIDDLQDSQSALSSEENSIFNEAIRQSLIAGEVVDCPEFSESNQQKMKFVYSELSEAFETIKKLQPKKEAATFFEQAYVFFEAQDIDRQRKLSNNCYTSEELFLPIILKSAGCRLIARELVDAQSNEDFDYRTFCFGIYNQFNDDIKDIFDDLEEGNVTPYSYFLSNLNQGKSQPNPYRVYWSVVNYLIREVFEDNPKSKRLLLERSINAHKSLRNSIGEIRYFELERTLLSTGNETFDQLVGKLVRQPNNIAWFDKLVSREVSSFFKKQESSKTEFKRRYDSAKKFIDDNLLLGKHRRIGSSQLSQAANYSLAAGGKRIRSVLAYVAMREQYCFSDEQTTPVIQLLEYMHTASIIFDDKPSQDNAAFRRGKPALHSQCGSEATAELAGVFLMMKAVEVQADIKGIEAERVLASIRYSANTTQAICEGQLLDLQSSNEKTDVQKLEKLSHLKTGLAIEASLMIPAILAGENDIEKEHIRKFSRNLGLAFQLKDDLLDCNGSQIELGKPIGQDASAEKASFVTCLGESEATARLYQYYFSALEALDGMKVQNVFYRQLLEFVTHRTH